MSDELHLSLMSLALEEARAAAGREEVPIGAVVVHAPTGRVLAKAGNRNIELCDPTAHAEVLAIREACRALGEYRLPECDLYVTLEPCPMCAAAIGFARLRALYFGAQDPKGGGVLHGPRIYEQATCHHRPQVLGGFHDAESAGLLKSFFQARR